MKKPWPIDVRVEAHRIKMDADAKWLAQHYVERPLNKAEWDKASPEKRAASSALVVKLRTERRKERNRLRHEHRKQMKRARRRAKRKNESAARSDAFIK